MGRIFCLMGKSSSGKDTIFRMLVKDSELTLNCIVPYTTRPIRENEEEGVQYHFVTEEEFTSLKNQGKIIEDRAYNTKRGLWRYFMVDDGEIKLDSGNYIIIGTIESFLMCRDYYGEDKVIPVMIDLDDGERLERALKRERAEEVPHYAELCRRFLADNEDFSEEKLTAAGITERFENVDLDKCAEKIKKFILSF